MRVRPITVSAFLGALAGVSAAAPAVASHEVVVYLTKTGFSPAASTVTAGDRVRFTVRDHKPHQVAKTRGPDAGALAPNVLEGQGSSITLLPSEPGTYTYIDRLNASRVEYRIVVRAPGALSRR